MKTSIRLWHFNIVIEADDDQLFLMLNQYPECKSDFLGNQIYISVRRADYINLNVNKGYQINPGFNVGPDVYLTRYQREKSDVIFRKSLDSWIRIDRDFEVMEISCEYLGQIEDCRNFIAAVIETFVADSVYLFGAIPLHGAVLKKDNLCIGLCGESGAGKSTTALQLLAMGGKLLSNDLFYLVLDTMSAYSLDKTLGVRENSLTIVNSYLKKIQSNNTCLYSTDQKYYDMQKNLCDDFITKSKLDVVFFLKKTGCAFPKINQCSLFSDFMRCCIIPPELLGPTPNFLETYKSLKKHCLLLQLELPDFSSASENAKIDSIIDWQFLEKSFVERS